jgi:hypothetical protein
LKAIVPSPSLFSFEIPVVLNALKSEVRDLQVPRSEFSVVLNAAYYQGSTSIENFPRPTHIREAWFSVRLSLNTYF